MDLDNICNEVLDELDAPYDIDKTLRNSFILVIKYLCQFPDRLSLKRKKINVDLNTKDGICVLANNYLTAFHNPTIPTLPATVPDEMVSLVMHKVFNYSEEELISIRKTHGQAMSTENAIGNYLERYLDSVLRPKGWAWCCGDFVKAIDFIKYEDGKWFELQIKNRNNSENSSSSKIREGTSIHKWYRTSSSNGKTRWNRVPEPMNNLGLSEEGFKSFVEDYLEKNMNLGKTPSPKLKF